VRLDGKVALLTGGGSGIGREVVLTFVREGAHVAALDLYNNAEVDLGVGRGDGLTGYLVGCRSCQ